MNIAGGKVVKSILMAEDIARLLPLVAEKEEYIMSVIHVNLLLDKYQNRLRSS